jgi:hypothetical protein
MLHKGKIRPESGQCTMKCLGLGLTAVFGVADPDPHYLGDPDPR